MLGSNDLVVDTYSALAHKAGLDPNKPIDLVPSWIDPESKRRLIAYMVLDAYLNNVARKLAVEIGPVRAGEIREQGDPRVLVNRIVAGVVGTDPALRVVGSVDPPPLEPQLPEEPPEITDGDPVLEARRQVWESLRDEAITAFTEQWAQWPRILETQAWLDEWQTQVRYSAKVYESESTGTVPLGDGVLVLGFEQEGTWPTLTVYEPDAYHPVLDDSNTDEFPSRVHLAWEYEDDEGDKFVRRITHELVEVPTWTPGYSGAEPTDVECHLTDKTWKLDGTSTSVWRNLDSAGGSAATLPDGTPVVDLPLGIDWIPILHLPNTPATQTHFGRSSIANVIQLIDSIIAVDTDVERAAAIAGTPILGVEADAPPAKTTLQPGTMLHGKISPIDLSSSVTSLRELQQDQLDRLSINAEVPGPVLGRVDADVIPSGVALSLMYDPFVKLVHTLRLTRTAKYPLLGKWAIRWAQVRDKLTVDGDGPAPAVEAVFPDVGIQDLAGITTWITQLVNAGVISKATAMQILKDNGIPIDDIQAELERIEREDLEGAVAIADATGSEQLAADRLGLDLEAQAPAAVAPDQAPPAFTIGGN